MADSFYRYVFCSIAADLPVTGRTFLGEVMPAWGVVVSCRMAPSIFPSCESNVKRLLLAKVAGYAERS